MYEGGDAEEEEEEEEKRGGGGGGEERKKAVNERKLEKPSKAHLITYFPFDGKAIKKTYYFSCFGRKKVRKKKV